MEKDEALRLRLSKNLKQELQLLADKDQRKLSDYIRLELQSIVEKKKAIFFNELSRSRADKVVSLFRR